jgi:hypothetical protein
MEPAIAATMRAPAITAARIPSSRLSLARRFFRFGPGDFLRAALAGAAAFDSVCSGGFRDARDGAGAAGFRALSRGSLAGGAGTVFAAVFRFVFGAVLAVVFFITLGVLSCGVFGGVFRVPDAAGCSGAFSTV